MFYNANYNYQIENIINYLRRSRQDVQREKLTGEDTLSAQRKLMSSVLDKMNIPYVQKSEIGSGDKIETRPVFKEVLNDLKTGKYNAVAVKEITRLSRGNMTDIGYIFDIITDNRILIITPYKIYDPSNPADLKQIRFEFFMGREEYEQTRERLNGARYNAALEGKWMGLVPFGYTRNKVTMKLEENENEANIVRLIYDLYLNGFEGKQVREGSISTILKRLEIKTAKGKKVWDTTQIHRVLTNEAYTGVSKFRTTKRNSKGKIEKRPENEHIIVENAHDVIIEKEAFNKVQEIMKNSKIPRARLDSETYELTGLFTCKKCNAKAVVNRYKRKRLNDEYFDMYIKCRNNCFSVKYNFAEEGVINFLKHLQKADKEEIFKIYSKSMEKQNIIERDNLKEQIIEAAIKKKDELKKKLKFFAEMHFKEVYSDEEYIELATDIKKEMKEIENTLEGNFHEIAATKEEINIKAAEIELIKIYEVYNNSKNAAAKNEVLRKSFENVTIEILEKGTKKQAPKINLDITMSYTIWQDI